jgi:tryptophan synthase beta chain
VLNHVCLHQTVIGQEAIAQMELAARSPTSSSAASAAARTSPARLPVRRGATARGRRTRFVAAEPAACPTLTRGVYAYDFGDTVGMTPLMPMYTLGHDFVPPPSTPAACATTATRRCSARWSRPGRRGARVPPERDLRGRRALRRAEGIIPAPEPAHAIRAAVEEAEAAKQAGEERVILFNLCGHGHFDMAAYAAYHAGELEDLEFSEADMESALAHLPEAPAIA